MWPAVGKFLRSNVLGLIAIFIALGGTAAAVSSTGPGGGSGGSKSAKPQQVAVVAKKGKRGPPGPQGLQGPPGQNGKDGAPGPGAVRLDFSEPETDNTTRPLGTAGELTISARCSQSTNFAKTDLIFGSTVAAEVTGTGVDDGGGPTTPFNFGPAVLTPNVPVALFPETSPNGGFKRTEIQALYENATRTIELSVHVLASDSTNSCQVRGVMVPAT
jgi:hypothetical protein